MDKMIFDGAAISRADQEFLASLDAHPLRQNPWYGTPCPLPPDFGSFDPNDVAQTEARLAFFADVVTWMLANYAYREGAFLGKTPSAISLADGEIVSLGELKGRMAPWALLHSGPRGALKVRSPVEDWMLARNRRSIRREEMRPDQPRPTFREDGYEIFNRYRPPLHPATGGSLAAFRTYFAGLIPDEEERTWMWHWLAHKARRPWIPMVAVIMVAEEFGSGRGTLFDILELVFGKDYVAPCSFGELTGKAAGARFNARLADALFVVVNEAVDEDGHQQSQRRTTYDALKNAIEPSPTARRRFEQKHQHVSAQRAAMSGIIATQHTDVVKLPWDDRRFSVITCGAKMTVADTDEIRAWMAVPENIGALHRELLAAPAAAIEDFDPFGTPPPFAGRLEMIGLGKTEVEDAYEAAMAALEGCALFTRTQAVRLISYFVGDSSGGGNQDRVKHTITKRAKRLRDRGEPYDRFFYRNRQDILYACTTGERRRWRVADRELVVAALDRTEARIARVVSAHLDDQLRATRNSPSPPPKEED
jgi:hypothetical protein